MCGYIYIYIYIPKNVYIPKNIIYVITKYDLIYTFDFYT